MVPKSARAKKKTRTPCGELVWRSNMRRCRFEDGSGYIVQAHANDILGFTKYQNAFKSVDEYD